MRPANSEISWVWQFFVKIDNTGARCIICERVYSYYSTISNLKKHLNRKHPTLEHTEGEQSQSQSTDDEEAEPSEKKPKIMLCPHTGEHIADPQCTSDDEHKLPERSEAEGDAECKEEGRRARTSWIWEHFTRIDKIRAECRLCGAEYIYKSTISNLRKHLAGRHPQVIPLQDKSRQSTPTTFQPETEGEEEEEAENGRRISWIWQFFNTIDSTHSTCRLCGRKISYESSITNLKRHLEKMHPEDVPEGPRRPSYKVRRATYSGRKTSTFGDKPVEYKVSASRASVSEEPNPKEQEQFTEVFIASPDSTEWDGAEAPSPPPSRRRTDDALEQFGRYVAVLMRRLPEHVANSMQAEFITKIMQAQMEHDKARASETTRGQNGINGNTESARCPLADVILEVTDS